MLTNKYILGKKLQNTQDIDIKESKKLKGPITLGRENKTITGVPKVFSGNGIGRGRGIT